MLEPLFGAFSIPSLVNALHNQMREPASFQSMAPGDSPNLLPLLLFLIRNTLIFFGKMPLLRSSTIPRVRRAVNSC